jgi:pyruvate kinase
MKKRKTNIICPIGPVSRSCDVIRKMAQAGMDVARLNFSHGEHDEHQRVIDTIRKVNRNYGHQIKILQDLEGYRVRIGRLKAPMRLKNGQEVWISHEKAAASSTIPIDADLDFLAFKKAMDIFIDDGKLHLKVVSIKGDRVKAFVQSGGILKQRKGINIPQLRLKGNVLTEKDRRDIEFGVAAYVDYIAQSFVRNQRDVERVAELVKPRLKQCQIIAKIENQDGVKNLDGIIAACDGILIPRGDLGVSFPLYEIPILQKRIIARCKKINRCVMTATHMLESMTENTRPTRAEVSDVANAIIDGTNFVTLSGETAVGKFPVACVQMMSLIIDYTESQMKSLRKL